MIEALRHDVDVVKVMQVPRLALSGYQVASFARGPKTPNPSFRLDYAVRQRL